MLEDYRKVVVEKQGQTELFSAAQIQTCIARGGAHKLDVIWSMWTHTHRQRKP